jgi:hypothetical protein
MFFTIGKRLEGGSIFCRAQEDKFHGEVTGKTGLEELGIYGKTLNLLERKPKANMNLEAAKLNVVQKILGITKKTF